MLDLALTAADVMTRKVLTAYPHSSIRAVARQMADHHVSGMPVLEEDGRLVGMISEGDLIVWREPPSERQAWWLDMLAEGFELSPGYLDTVSAARETVRTIMKTDLVTAMEATPLAEVARLMASRGVNRLPVVRDGKLVGIVARADLVKALARG
jgi:CBS domain-containing protein